MISKVETESEGSLHRRKVEHTFEYTLIALHSTMCIVNHFVLEQIASLAVTGTEWNTLAILRIISISLPFFFFFSFCHFIIRRNLIDQGSSPLDAPRRKSCAPRRLRIMASFHGRETKGNKPGRGVDRRGRCNAHGNRNPGRAGRPRQLVSST